MQVVLFCGGFGVRMKDYGDSNDNNHQKITLPKPLVKIGNRPIIWHIMKYYSHFGFNDFIAIAIPPISPPPEVGTMTVSSSGNCSSISSPIVP